MARVQRHKRKTQTGNAQGSQHGKRAPNKSKNNEGCKRSQPRDKAITPNLSDGGNVYKVQLRHKCQPQYIQALNKKLNGLQATAVRQSPFEFLLRMEEFEVNSTLLRDLVGRWQPEEKGFSIKGTVVKFEPYDIAMILGLRIKGIEVDVHRAYGASLTHDLLKKHCGTTNPSPTKIINAAEKLNRKEDEEAFLRLYVMLAFETFFFPISSGGLYSNLCKLLDDRSKVNEYAWGQSVYDFLVHGIEHTSKCLSEKLNSHQVHLNGCAVVLQIWVLEHVPNLCERPSGKEFSFPRVLGWENKILIKGRKAKDRLDNAQVIPVLVATEEELKVEVIAECQDLLPQSNRSPKKPPVEPPNWQQMYEDICSIVHQLQAENVSLNAQRDQLKNLVASFMYKNDIDANSENCSKLNGEVLKLFPNFEGEPNDEAFHGRAMAKEVENLVMEDLEGTGPVVGDGGRMGDLETESAGREQVDMEDFHADVPTENDPHIIMSELTAVPSSSSPVIGEQADEQQEPANTVWDLTLKVYSWQKKNERVCKLSKYKRAAFTAEGPGKKSKIDAEADRETDPSTCNRLADKKSVLKHIQYSLSEDEDKVFRRWQQHPFGTKRGDGTRFGTTKDTKLWSLTAKDIYSLVKPPGAKKDEEYWISTKVVEAYGSLLTNWESGLITLRYCTFIVSPYAVGDALKATANEANVKWASKLQAGYHNRVFLPCVVGGHYVLVIADGLMKNVVCYDSLWSPRRKKDIFCLANWLRHACKEKLKYDDANKWDLQYPKNIPQQENGMDCGVYLITYMACLVMCGSIVPFTLAQVDVSNIRCRILVELSQGHLCGY